MRPMLIGAPAIEPVSLADPKSWLREDGAEEDELIQALIVAARMTPTTCRLKFDNIVNFRGFPHMPGNDRVIAYPSSLAPAMDGGSFFR